MCAVVGPDAATSDEAARLNDKPQCRGKAERIVESIPVFRFRYNRFVRLSLITVPTGQPGVATNNDAVRMSILSSMILIGD
jgi:hypothetical protein